MVMQYSAVVANATLDAVETAVGVSPVLKIYTGAPPLNVSTARSGTVLVTMTLPSDWMAAAALGSKAKLGAWSDAAADATGTAGYFTIFASDGITAHIQGTVGTSQADMILDTTAVNVGLPVVVNTFTLVKSAANYS
jgi:hypothetical protein